MKKNIIYIILLFVSYTVQSQEIINEKWHNDTKSIDAIIKTTYQVISGNAGERDWNRFKNLFDDKAQMGAVLKNKNGETICKYFTPEQYIKNNNDFLLKNKFIENEISRTINQFNNLAQVFSTYEFEVNDKKIRGINSIQLINQNNRWYILSLIWEEENENNLIPKKYLPNK